MYATNNGELQKELTTITNNPFYRQRKAFKEEMISYFGYHRQGRIPRWADHVGMLDKGKLTAEAEETMEKRFTEAIRQEWERYDSSPRRS